MPKPHPIPKTSRFQPGCLEDALDTVAGELQISISAELLQELLAHKSIRACEIRSLNAQTARQLKEICMNCCANNLYSCAMSKQTGKVLQLIEQHIDGYPIEAEDV